MDAESQRFLSQARRNWFDAPHRFGEFWAAWENRIGPEPAYRVWVKKRLWTIADDIIPQVKLYFQTERVKRGVVLNPATYLNGARYEDDIAPAPHVKAAARVDRDIEARRRREREQERRIAAVRQAYIDDFARLDDEQIELLRKSVLKDMTPYLRQTYCNKPATTPYLRNCIVERARERGLLGGE